MRSRVKFISAPTSSRVRISPAPSRPKRIRRIFCSRSSRGWSNFSIAAGIIFTAATSKGDSAERSSTTSPNSASPSSRRGSESEIGSERKRKASMSLSSGISHSSQSSLMVGGRPNLSSRRDCAFCTRASVSPACTGRRIVRPVLAKPPRGVGRELKALAPVELLDGVHQAEVALLDEVEQRQTRGLVLLRNRDHQTKVGLHEVPFGLVAAVPGALQRLLTTRRQLDLLIVLGRLELGLGVATLFDGLG